MMMEMKVKVDEWSVDGGLVAVVNGDDGGGGGWVCVGFGGKGDEKKREEMDTRLWKFWEFFLFSGKEIIQ